MDACDCGNPVRMSFPLTAIVGGEKLIEALSFALISPDIRSVLICGPSGSGKSVAARSVGDLAPGKRIVEVPANLTLDQLFGTLEIESAIRYGRKTTSDSILGRADGNILVADNINLQDSDILHSLMNSVQDGIVLSEMNGLSLSATCDTLLIGTMNPDEGELDGHILDRFDMCVYTEPCVFPEDRREIVRRVLAFERDPKGFRDSCSASTDELASRIESAKHVDVTVPDGFPGMISEICNDMCIEGHRGDVAVMNTLMASAAFDGHDTATQNDLKRAAFLCLRHRRRDLPPESDEPEESEEPDDIPDSPPEGNDAENDDDPGQSGKGAGGDGGSDDGRDGDSDGEDGSDDAGGSDRPQERVFDIGEQFDVRDFIPPESSRSRNRRSGRQDSSVSKDGSGRTVGYIVPRGKVRDVALIASIRAAAPYQLVREHNGLAVSLHNDDLREKVRVRRKSATILFVVDGSGSMGAQSRMVAVKGAILSMLYDSYRRRDQVGLVIFRGDRADVVLPPTRSVFTAYRSLKEMPTGGRTPLHEGLRTGYQVLRKDADAGLEPVMVILTDGRGNVKGEGFSSAEESLKHVAGIISESGIRTIVVDTEAGLVRFGKAIELAAMMDSSYIALEDLDADRLSSSVMSALKLLDRRSVILHGDTHE